MPQTLDSDMAQRSFNALRERIEQQGTLSPVEAWQLIHSCETGFLILERVQHQAQELLNMGVEGKQLAFILKECVDAIDLGMQSLEGASGRIAVAQIDPQERAHGVSKLMRLREQPAERRDKLSALLNWLETPTPDIDPASLPGGRGDPQASGYMDLDDFATRLLR